MGGERSKGSVRGDENPGLRAGEGKDTRGRWGNRKISGFDIAKVGKKVDCSGAWVKERGSSADKKNRFGVRK